MLFIGQNSAIKTYYCKKRTKNKNKKDSLRAAFFMQGNKLYLTRFRITVPAIPDGAELRSAAYVCERTRRVFPECCGCGI